MLSIIIPTLNEEKYLPLLLNSIKKQSFTDYEIVVADAGSEDRTTEIAKEYGCRVTAGGLPAKGRNQGAEASQGDLLLFLDAEVLLPEDFLEKALSEFAQRNLDVGSCGLEPIKEEWIPRFVSARLIYDIAYNLPAKFLENVFPYAASFILVKKEKHHKLNGFDEGIKLSEDHSYARRAARIGKFGFLSSVKAPLFLRRCEKDGILRTNLKYICCNVFNVFLGDVRTDIFKYYFGQYNGFKKKTKKIHPILQFFWYILFYIVVLVALIKWLIIILVFTPKLIKVYFKK